MNEAINLKEKFKLFSDLWSPKRIGKLNGQQILLAKIKGEFVFHKHDDEDELFLVMKGQLELVLEDKTIILNKGEFFIVQKKDGAYHLDGNYTAFGKVIAGMDVVDKIAGVTTGSSQGHQDVPTEPIFIKEVVIVD